MEERQVVVATHGHCFDGMCSAALFTRLIRHLAPDGNHRFTYLSMGYGPGSNGVDPTVLSGDINAILDFRFSSAPQLTWYFDHHISAFPRPEERATYDRHVAEHDGDRVRRMFHDGAYG